MADTDDSMWMRPTDPQVVDDAHPTPPTDDLDWVRRTLVQLDDEQRALAADDLASRHAILQTIDDLRAMLRAGYADGITAVRTAWDDRAGRKGAHEVDYEAVAGMVRSMMPSQGR